MLLWLRGDGWLSFDSSIAKRSVIIVLSAIFVLRGFSILDFIVLRVFCSETYGRYVDNQQSERYVPSV
jgi:hypothetical protein